MIVASPTLTTETLPFTPHAQAACRLLVPARRPRASGKGIPMMKPGTPMMARTTIIFQKRDQAMVA